MRRYTLEIRGRTFVVEVDEMTANRFSVVVGGENYEVQLSGDEHLPEATIHPAFTPSEHASPGPAEHASAAPAAVMTGGGAAPADVPARPASPPVSARPAPRPAPRAAGSASAGTLAAPMPGVILDVSVKAGDAVTRGQEIAVLEAMKMQNIIKSPRDGTIAEVCVTTGQAVGHGDPIVRYAKG
jgi:biotin carboxyl carrier protein